MTTFWQENQVGGPFADYDESIEALLERQQAYPALEKFMPTKFPGKRILDFGCGPGHDTLQFLLQDAAHVTFADISWQALQTTNDRLNMHGLRVKATAMFADDQLPEVDHAHCAGVLHHMAFPEGALLRLREASPTLNVMVYDGERSEHSTSLVPITEWWTPKEFLQMAKECGWKGHHVGSYPCDAEWRPNCWAACFTLE